jgi:hypothetical protein
VNRKEIDTWDKCFAAFLEKIFPLGKTNALCGRILSFQQATSESLPEAWERGFRSTSLFFRGACSTLKL